MPIGALKTHMSLNVPQRRVHAKSAGYTGYTLEVSGLPWGGGPHKVVRYRADGDRCGEMLDSQEGEGVSVVIQSNLAVPDVEIIEISQGSS
ncbi:hypothetical protein EWE75_19470 [Sphingomonas populi]|uniref:Uncharacterized protein n=1 Tax=Sphingomonas populi TaxID=2484750 RepID=A0A4Q6XUE1_9SPHN|nr:hypothetical protein [Sphingomonas populi]RZF61104.1 hypothetical protein EWE75_19470 [Sphingomonas populi]